MSALSPFHKALFQRLSGDAGLAAYQHASMVVAGVRAFDHVPSGTPYPYIALESYSESGFNIFGGAGFEDVAQVGTWDDYRGKARTLEIMALVGVALEAPLVVVGYGTVGLRLELATMAPDPSGLQHGVQRVRAVNLR